jgi:hypothetical protein
MKYRIEEDNNIVIAQSISIALFFTGVIVAIILTFLREDYWGIGIFFFTLPIVVIINLICDSVSTLKKRTRIYLDEIRDKIDSCKSIEEYIDLYQKFYGEVTENNIIRLPYPVSIKQILNELKTIIETLEKHK